ncbi:MAG: flavin reductase family protein, partial [Panacagrimonas sp.]
MSDHYRKVQLIAGGIGITPLLAMAQTLAAQGIDFDFHVCARNQEQLPFANELQQAGYRSQVQTHLDDGDQAQQLSAQSIPTYSKGQGLYLCGPQAFMNHVIGLAESRGWPLEAIHTESFVTGAVEMGNNRAFTVELSRSNKTLEIPAEKSLLTVLQENRIEAHGVCTQGLCGACRCKVIQGEVEHRDVVLSEREHQQGIMTPCVSRAAGERLVLDL